MVLDIIAIVILLIFAVISAKKGFVKSVFGFLITIASLAIAVFCANMVVEATGGLFGLQETIHSGIIDLLSGIEGFDQDISAAGLAADLEGKFPTFVIDMILEEYGVDAPIGTTIAMQIAPPITEFVMFIIGAIALFIVCKLVLTIVKAMLVALIENLALVNALDKILGFVLGALQGALIVCVLLLVISFIPNDIIGGVVNLIDTSMIVGPLYHNNPLGNIIF